MKNSIQFVLIVVICTVFLACSGSEGDLIFDKDSMAFDSFEKSHKLQFKKVAAIDSYTPSGILPFDSLIFLLSDNKTFSVQIVSLNSGKIIGERIRQGGGPGEALGIMSSGILSDSIWFHDVTLGKLMKFHLRDFVEQENPPNSSYKISEFFYSTELLNDSTMIGTGMETSPNKFQYYDLFNQTIREHQDAYDIPNSIPVIVAKDALRSYINARDVTTGANVALVGRYSDVVEFIDTKEPNRSKAVQGPEIFDPIFEIGYRGENMFMSKVKETKKAYVNSVATKDYIFALYSGGLRTEGRKWSEGNTMHVFDWEGNPRFAYDIGEMVYAFGVDDSNKRLFVYKEDTNELLYADY